MAPENEFSTEGRARTRSAVRDVRRSERVAYITAVSAPQAQQRRRGQGLRVRGLMGRWLQGKTRPHPVGGTWRCSWRTRGRVGGAGGGGSRRRSRTGPLCLGSTWARAADDGEAASIYDEGIGRAAREQHRLSRSGLVGGGGGSRQSSRVAEHTHFAVRLAPPIASRDASTFLLPAPLLARGRASTKATAGPTTPSFAVYIPSLVEPHRSSRRATKRQIPLRSRLLGSVVKPRASPASVSAAPL